MLIFQHICTFTPFRFLRLDVRALILLQFEFVQQNISNSFCNPDHSIVRADWDGFFQGEQERCRWHMPDQLVATATILYYTTIFFFLLHLQEQAAAEKYIANMHVSMYPKHALFLDFEGSQGSRGLRAKGKACI